MTLSIEKRTNWSCQQTSFDGAELNWIESNLIPLNWKQAEKESLREIWMEGERKRGPGKRIRVSRDVAVVWTGVCRGRERDTGVNWTAAAGSLEVCKYTALFDVWRTELILMCSPVWIEQGRYVTHMQTQRWAFWCLQLLTFHFSDSCLFSIQGKATHIHTPFIPANPDSACQSEAVQRRGSS